MARPTLLLPAMLALPAVLSLGACAMTPSTGALPKYTVFFTEWSARLDDPAISTVRAAAQAYAGTPTLPVRVVGFADPVGSLAANKDLAALRAQMVTDELLKDGVPASKISTTAYGATDFVESGQESRRVTIAVGTPAGTK